MRAPILAIASLVLLCATALLTAGQTGTDKNKDSGPTKEPDKITADTEINGKTLAQWIKLIPGKDRSMTKAAIEAILLYGPELAQKAVPVMIAELKKHNPPTARLDLDVRTTIPQPMALILSSLKEPDQHDVKEAVALMKKMLKDPQVIVKHRVAQAVAQMGPLAKETIPELVHLVKDRESETWQLRNDAVLALGTVAYEEKAAPQQQVVAALYAGLEDSAVQTRLSAIQALNYLRVGLDAALKPLLLKEMQNVINKDHEPLCKLRAHLTIYAVLENPADKAKRRELISKFLNDKEHLVRMETVQAFGLIGAEAKDQVPRLLSLLTDKDLNMVALSMVALAQIKDKKALEQLQFIAANTNMPEVIRATAQDAIAIISGLKTKKDEPTKGGNKP